ncbi:hypothetical protein AQUCO_01100142v1 [Aquilegia coerulea]|uniref:Receptor-like serine/threonine-protein kinase n=1 Tax=Aquilegia coerulea TaxID=218851 RepID=A0A2G5E5V6_AQUCA|nr:hypothetical protein AQUCO_01100142v1 [Aquilegia coerulea]
MSSGQSLNLNQTLISKSGIYELGYFQPGNSPNYYIGIWYKKISIQNKTVVWVGNRNTPVTDPFTAELKLLEDGNLVLLNQSKAVVWSTNSSLNPLNSSVAVLGDDGNLVLRKGDKPSDVFWQSFDYPTDTWLPGGRFRYDNRIKKSQLLTSWKSPNDPSEGLISLRIDPSGGQFVILWNRTRRYWSSGQWNGQIFSGIPDTRLLHFLNFSFLKNENESVFTYSLNNTSIISWLVLELSGQIKQYTWDEKHKRRFCFGAYQGNNVMFMPFVALSGVCNQRSFPFCTCMDGFKPRYEEEWNLSNYSSGGCVRKTSLQCGDKDNFFLMPNVKLRDNAQRLAVASADDCKLACWSNCNCSAYAYTSFCSIWDADLLSLQQLSDDEDGGEDLYLKLAASDFQKSGGKDKKTNTGVIVGAVAGIGAILVLVLFYIRRWRIGQSVGKSKSFEGSLMVFAYKDLQNATNNFYEKLGGGAFGSVFKGTLPDSSVIAVKKLESLGQGEKQFRAEVSTIGTIQHVNLVRLCGFCSEGDTRLLVYDYMPNGSLDYHIFGQNDSAMMNWKTRYQIALGIARGLSYLHEKCRDCIIHCDIKPENVLLDADFYPKVADFGLAKLIGREFSRVLTTMRGTRGYLAPEWISGVAITVKADVYSYGMMLFEIVSGRRNIDHSDEGKFVFFPIWAARKIIEDGNVLALLDSRLQGDANVEELTREPGIDFNETFAPVARMETIRTVLAIAAQWR